MRARLALIVLSVLCSAGKLAEGAERHGFLIGLSVGVGAANGSGATHLDGFQVDVHAGAAIGSHWAAIAVLDVIDDALGYGSVLFAGVAARYWPMRRWWVEGGLGAGTVGAQRAVPEREGLAAWLAAGFEVLQRRNFAMDLQARYGTLGTPRYERVSLSLGLTWY